MLDYPFLLRIIGHTVCTYMHAICNTLSMKSGKKQFLVFSVQRTANICRTKRSCTYVCGLAVGIYSLAISYNIRNHATYKFQPTIKFCMHKGMFYHESMQVAIRISIFMQYLTINIQPDVSIDVNCSNSYRWHFGTCIAADGAVLNRSTHSMSHDRKTEVGIMQIVVHLCIHNVQPSVPLIPVH